MPPLSIFMSERMNPNDSSKQKRIAMYSQTVSRLVHCANVQATSAKIDVVCAGDTRSVEVSGRAARYCEW